MDSLYRKYLPISMDDALLGLLASMGNITAREIPWNITSGDCVSLLSVHNGKSKEGLLGCHNADLPEHQKQLWTELCYSSLSATTDRNLLQLFCSDYSLHWYIHEITRFLCLASSMVFICYSGAAQSFFFYYWQKSFGVFAQSAYIVIWNKFESRSTGLVFCFVQKRSIAQEVCIFPSSECVHC